MKKYLVLSAAIFLLAAACGKTQPQAQTQPVIPGAQTPTTVNTPAYFNVQETVQGSSLNMPSNEAVVNTTALMLLKSGHKVETKNYSGIGEFVESIDGIMPDSQHFWAFYVNGKSSNVGASSYVLKSGDKTEWKLEAISSSGQ